MAEIEPTRIIGCVKRVTVDAPVEVGQPPKVRLVVDVAGFDGNRLDGLVGVLSRIEITPVQQVLEGLR